MFGFVKKRRGIALAEYALLGTLVAVASIMALERLGDEVKGQFDKLLCQFTRPSVGALDDVCDTTIGPVGNVGVTPTSEGTGSIGGGGGIGPIDDDDDLFPTPGPTL